MKPITAAPPKSVFRPRGSSPESRINNVTGKKVICGKLFEPFLPDPRLLIPIKCGSLDPLFRGGGISLTAVVVTSITATVIACPWTRTRDGDKNTPIRTSYSVTKGGRRCWLLSSEIWFTFVVVKWFSWRKESSAWV